jgi:hypothetical protein
MQLKLLPLLCLLGTTLSAPISSPSHPLTKRDAALIKRAWTAVGTAYQNLDAAVKGINPNILMNGVSQSQVPRAHQGIMDTYRDTEKAVRGTPVIGYGDAFGLSGPAQALARIQQAAIASVVKAKPVIVNTRERVNVYNMLVQELNAQNQWALAFNALIPVGQKEAGNQMSKQVTDAFKKAITLFQMD